MNLPTPPEGLRLLRWRSEKRVLDLLERHVSLCVSASDELVLAYKAKAYGSLDEAGRHIRALSGFEEQADAVRREMVDLIAGGVMPPLSKSDLMSLVAQIDLVADWCKEAGRILEILPLNGFSDELKELLFEFVKMDNRCVHTISRVVRLLYTDHEDALDACNLVEMIEEGVDALYIETLRMLHASGLDAPTLLLAGKLVESLEMIGDSCEDTADLIRAVIVSTFH